MINEKCIRCGKRTPWFCLIGNGTLSAFQILIGFISGSGALIADGTHTFTDVIGTVMVLISRVVSTRPPDKDHPYGHGKAEFMSSVFVYVLLIFLSAAIFSGGIMMIWKESYRKPEAIAILAAMMSVFINGFMYKLGACSGARNNSPALLANAYENRADALSAVAVIIGISASIAIHPICDPIAAMLVGVHIFANCVSQLRESLSGLMDKALPGEIVSRIRSVALAQKGVECVNYVKSRQTGTRYWVDVGIGVDADLNVCESEGIAGMVRSEVMRRSEKFHSVEVFVAPCQLEADGSGD